ncbi:MAG: glycoside hydrolase 43 family protein [Ruminococcus sp.]|nr:glycoside hydrolase 43 family protein [Ruminococcus sp.]
MIWADVPDMDYLRVGDTYYMISTTMFFNPGAPIMKSKDLVSWEICNYVYDTLENNDTTNLLNGKSCYGNGQWAASLKYKNGKYIVFFASNDQGKSYIFQTDDIENGTWTKYTLSGVYHDASLFFDDDGRNYLIYGSGTISIKQLNSAVTGFEPNGVSKVLMKGQWSGLCEGSHFYKIDGYYYNFVIGNWPRSEYVFRSKDLLGNYDYKQVMSAGVGTYGAGCAQGGLIDTADGKWYSIMFQDHGAVGRIPSLIPVSWQDHWPVFGVNGKVPTTLTIDTDYTDASLAVSDEFGYTDKSDMPLEWQWNHNPDNTKWSLTEREGWLRLKTGAVAKDLLTARNSLTQRTEGPACVSEVKMDVANMKTGDYAGIAAFQEVYGQVGVYVDGSGNKKLFMAVNGDGNKQGIGCSGGVTKIVEEVPLTSDTVYFRIDYLFSTFDGNTYSSSNDIDKANFYYSYDGVNWKKIGSELKMQYKLTLFTGYRTAIFNYATKASGGYVDVDWYHYSRTEYQPALR